PSNVKNINDTDIKILGSGIDSLVMAVDVRWENESLFEYLGELKENAKENNKEFPGSLGPDENMKWYFNMYPSGAKGWEWILKGQEFTLIIGNWLEPISRPSVLVDIGSETLWRVGPRDSVDWILELIRCVGGGIISVKPSRVDLCVDILMHESLWTEDLKNFRVTRARKLHPYYENERLTGMMIGKGAISARIYDKEYEIRTQSKKFWMFDIWGIEEIPEDMRIIRIEFQLRRQVIKDLGIDTIKDLYSLLDFLWAYCTKKWLKFQDRPGKHHTQRETFKWWKIIQKGFLGVQDAIPLIRAKAISIDSEKLRNQALGFFTSLMASEAEKKNLNIDEDIDYREILIALIKSTEWVGKDNYDFNEEVKRKRIKYHRTIKKLNQIIEERIGLGFPIGNISVERND
ncbi:MAG: hypothetical protein JW882_00790, partial [Deltaproteobacteria bacterium]|nr:hypothetical protein [Deltaproteobacteria bacterium]